METLKDLKLQTNSSLNGPTDPIKKIDFSKAKIKTGDGFRSTTPYDDSSQLPGVDAESFRKGNSIIRLPNEGGVHELESQRADNQRWYQYLGKAVLNFGSRFAAEVIKMPVDVGVAAAETFDKVAGTSITSADSYAKSFEQNPFLNGIDKLSQELSNAIPLYERDRNKYGGFVRETLLNPFFYATQGSDALGFAASFLTPGLALKALEAGEFGAKLLNKGISLVSKGERIGIFKAAKSLGATAEGMNVALATSMSTFLESSSESRDAMKQLRIQLEKDGKFNKQEIDEKVAAVGKNVFLSNLVILAGPNLLVNKILLGGYRGFAVSRFSTTGKGLETAIKYSELSGGVKYAKIAQDLGLGIFSEGMEELSQSTVTNFYSAQVNKGDSKSPLSILPELAKEYMKTLGTKDGQQAVFLGALMGGVLGGIGAHQDIRNTNEINNRIAANMGNNFQAFAVNIAKPYKKTKKGNIVFDPHSGRPILDGTKTKKAIKALGNSSNMADLLEYAKRTGNKILYKQLFNEALTEIATPYTQVEGGVELLLDQLEGIFNLADVGNESIKSGSKTESKNKEKYLSELRDQIKAIKDYSDVYSNFTKYNVSDLKQDKLSDNDFNEFKALHAISFIQEMSNLKLAENQLDELNRDYEKYAELTGEDIKKNPNPAFTLAKNFLEKNIEVGKKKLKGINSPKGTKLEFEKFKKAKLADIKDEEDAKKGIKKNEKEKAKNDIVKEREAKNEEDAKKDIVKNRDKKAAKKKAKKELKKRKKTPAEKFNNTFEAGQEVSNTPQVEENKQTSLDFNNDFEAGQEVSTNPQVDENGQTSLKFDEEFDSGQAVSPDYLLQGDDSFEGGEDRDTKGINNETLEKESNKETSEYEEGGAKNETVAKVIGIDNKGDIQYDNITNTFITFLKNFTTKVREAVGFKVSYYRPGVSRGQVNKIKYLLNKKNISKKEREDLIKIIPINIVINGTESPLSKAFLRKEVNGAWHYVKQKGNYKTISIIVDALLNKVPIEEIVSSITFQAGGELNTSEGNKNNILDLEIFKNKEVSDVELFIVDRKGELKDKNLKLVKENRTSRKSGSIYLKTKYYSGKEIFINLDTRGINENEADIITELFSNLMEKKTMLSELPDALQEKITSSLDKELNVIGKPLNDILISEFIDFLVYLGESPTTSNHLDYNPIRNRITIREKTYKNSLNDEAKNDLKEFLLSSKDRKVSFHGEGKDNIRNIKYKTHMLVDNILTTNINTGENVPMYKGNVNIYIDNNNIVVGEAKRSIEARKVIDSEASNSKVIKTTNNQVSTTKYSNKRPDSSEKARKERLSKNKNKNNPLEKTSKDSTIKKC